MKMKNEIVTGKLKEMCLQNMTLTNSTLFNPFNW